MDDKEQRDLERSERDMFGRSFTIDTLSNLKQYSDERTEYRARAEVQAGYLNRMGFNNENAEDFANFWNRTHDSLIGKSLERASAGAAIVLLILPILLSINLTGNVISEVAQRNTNILSILSFIAGVILSYVYVVKWKI